MIKSFIQYFNGLTDEMDYELNKDLNFVEVKFYDTSNEYGSFFTIRLNKDTQLLTLRKDGYLIDEIKVYNDMSSGEQSLNVALEDFINIINQSMDIGQK